MILEEICRIANVYMITPHRVINIYNKVGKKRYINQDYKKAINITERYIKTKYKKRTNTIKWDYEKIIQFNKWRE